MDVAIFHCTLFCFSWLARTDPKDVARVESRTFISTENMRDTIPVVKNSITGTLGNWMSPDDLDTELNMRFPGCMKGRTMFVIPFSMGPVGSALSKIGIELTDSAYVAASMRIMTRVGKKVLKTLGNGDFVKCLHSVGAPYPLKGGFLTGLCSGLQKRINENNFVYYEMNIDGSKFQFMYFAFSLFQSPWSVTGPAILRKPSLHIYLRGTRSAPMEADTGVTHYWAKSASPSDLVQYLVGERAGLQNICW